MTRSTGRPIKYPLRTMQIDETIVVADTTQKKINKVRPYYAPMKFRVRQFMVRGEMRVRVTRIA